ncbi:MAG TPA: NAD(P)-dependent oxidoreductase [Saprospiraceae bacterium]|nr:NAD(P)-dependent oxidoreductase [Saprospiraceae bacterium]
MSNKTVILTGISGFIGSHIGEYLVNQNYQIIALIQKSSDLWRCRDYISKVDLLYYNDPDLIQNILKFDPSTLIHTAWIGVTASERTNWENQLQNINLLGNLFSIISHCKLTKFIALGSQAEYGSFEGRIDETQQTQPTNSYGSVKLACLSLIQSYCYQNKIDWYWLRLFSIYGPKENGHWFIPSAINHAILEQSMKLTGCQQKYDYLYVKDLCKAINKVLETPHNSGVYNLTSNSSQILKNVIEEIKKITKTKINYQYGVIPYRENQIMHMEGNSDLFYTTFKFSPNSDLETNLIDTINYYKNNIPSSL